jgi:uncharacterized membrane protein YdfJ with MMPL/SSD domain
VAGSLGSLSSASRQFLETMGFFTGVGMLILFLAALALGRFSVVAVKDAALAESFEPSLDEPFPTSAGMAAGETSYPISTGQFPSVGQYQASSEQAATTTTQEQRTTTQEQDPTTTSPFDAFNRQATPPSDPG